MDSYHPVQKLEKEIIGCKRDIKEAKKMIIEKNLEIKKYCEDNNIELTIFQMFRILKSLELRKIEKMIAELKELKSNIVTNFDSEGYEEKLQSMDFGELMTTYIEKKDEIKIMQEQAKKGNLG